MCLDAQGGIKAKRQPHVVGAIVKSCGVGRDRRDVFVVIIQSNVKTENTYRTARLEALFKSSQSSFVPSKIRSPNSLSSDCVLGPSRCLVGGSAVLSFASTRSTDRRFSRIHCCMAKHRISICLSPPGPLR